VEYYAWKGSFTCIDFLIESTNSVNYVEPSLPALASEDIPLGPQTEGMAEERRSGCCQSPVTAVSALIDITLTDAGVC